MVTFVHRISNIPEPCKVLLSNQTATFNFTASDFIIGIKVQQDTIFFSFSHLLMSVPVSASIIQYGFLCSLIPVLFASQHVPAGILCKRFSKRRRTNVHKACLKI